VLKENPVYLIAFFGALMMLLSVVMMVNPEYWSRGIVKFRPVFRPAGVVSFAFGIFIIYTSLLGAGK